MNHVSNDQLLEFIDDPGDQDEVVALHLAICRDCRLRLQQFQQAKNVLPFVPADNENGLADKDNSHRAMKARLHSRLFAIKAGGAEAATGSAESAAETFSDTGGWQTLLQWFSFRPLPVWQLIPLAVLCVYIGFTMTLGSSEKIDDVLIANYMDKAVINYTPVQEKQPGVGFFYQAREIEKPFGKLKASIDRDYIKLSWPVISGASHYDIRIYTDATDKLIFRKDAIDKNVTLVEKSHFKKGINYQWEVHAITDDQLHARVKAGFVIHQE